MLNAMLNEQPSVAVKRRFIPLIMDFCMDNKMAFRVIPRHGADEWEVQFDIQEVLPAVALGMFLRENKLELTGFSPMLSKPAPAAPRTKTKKSQAEDEPVPTPAPAHSNMFDMAKPEQVVSAVHQEEVLSNHQEEAPDTWQAPQAADHTLSDTNTDHDIEPLEAPFDMPGLQRNSPGMF
jgi:hypothetical protein